MLVVPTDVDPEIVLCDLAKRKPFPSRGIGEDDFFNGKPPRLFVDFRHILFRYLEARVDFRQRVRIVQIERIQQRPSVEFFIDGLVAFLKVHVGISDARVVVQAFPRPDFHAVLVADADGLRAWIVMLVGLHQPQRLFLTCPMEGAVFAVLGGYFAWIMGQSANIDAQVDFLDSRLRQLFDLLFVFRQRIVVLRPFVPKEDIVQKVDGGADLRRLFHRRGWLCMAERPRGGKRDGG